MRQFCKKTIFMFALMIVFSLTSIVYADIADEASGIISDLNSGSSGGGALETPISKILGYITYTAYAVAIGMIIIIGINWMSASAGGKAKIKDTFLPYLIGAICVGAATTIASFAINFGSSGGFTQSANATYSYNDTTNKLACKCTTCKIPFCGCQSCLTGNCENRRGVCECSCCD